MIFKRHFISVGLILILASACSGIENLETIELLGPTTIPYTATPVPPTVTPTPVPVIQVATPRAPQTRPLLGLSNTGQIMPIRDIAGHDDQRVFGLAFSPDGRILASAGHDGTVRLWEAETGAALMTFNGHTAEVLSVVFSTDGTVLASGGNDGTVRLWEIPVDGGYRNQPLAVLGSSGNVSINAILFNPSDTTLLGAGLDVRADERAVLWRWQMNTPAGFSLSEALQESSSIVGPFEQLSGHNNSIATIVTLNDGESYATGSFDRTLRTWLFDASEATTTIDGFGGWVTALSATEDGGIISGDFSGIITSITADGTRLRQVDTGKPLWALATNPAETVIAAGSGEGLVTLWAASTGDALGTLFAHEGPVRQVVFSPDGSLLATSGDDGEIRIWATQR